MSEAVIKDGDCRVLRIALGCVQMLNQVSRPDVGQQFPRTTVVMVTEPTHREEKQTLCNPTDSETLIDQERRLTTGGRRTRQNKSMTQHKKIKSVEPINKQSVDGTEKRADVKKFKLQ